MPTYIALLRAVNAAGHDALPMPDLRAIFDSYCCQNVRTYAQSGSVVFETSANRAKTITGTISEAIRQRFGYEVPVVVRTRAELDKVIAANPFPPKPGDEHNPHVAFCSSRPTQEAIRAIDPTRSPGDRFRVINEEVYLHLANGPAKTKLTTQYLDATLECTSTLRDWPAINELAQLAAE